MEIDLTLNGEAIPMDGIIPAYVVNELPVYVGMVVVMGLISAGLSTLEGLIQALATTITADLVTPLAGSVLPADEDRRAHVLLVLNRIAIGLLAVVSAWLSWQQVVSPKLSVAIFAQNGVYAYFSAAFVPILFGMFLKSTRRETAIVASVTAIVVHFVMYYGHVPVPGTLATGENPGVAAAVAVISSLVVGALVQMATGRRQRVPA